jgi:hypothetical protein
MIPLEVKNGNSMSIDIRKIADNAGSSNWLVTIANNTTGKNWRKVIPYNSSMTSAEWIQEMPLNALTESYIPLSNFGTIQFTNGFATKDGRIMPIGATGAKRMTMVNSLSEALAVPSNLGPDGTSFSVDRTANQAVPLSDNRQQRHQWQMPWQMPTWDPY